jgi:hypothetical protein
MYDRKRAYIKQISQNVRGHKAIGAGQQNMLAGALLLRIHCNLGICRTGDCYTREEGIKLWGFFFFFLKKRLRVL